MFLPKKKLSDKEKKMLGAKYLITIGNRSNAEAYIDFFADCGIEHSIHRYCKGTAGDELLELLSLEKDKKIVFKSVILDSEFEAIKRKLLLETDVGRLGGGIAFTIPLDGIGGQTSKEYLLGDKQIEKKGNDMDYKYVLIISIVDKGNTDMVMIAAKSAGASGGSVVHCYGTGKDVEKFFGVAISKEKEMVYIVAKRENRDDIMRAIMNEKDFKPVAHGVVFSLPVDNVMGIKAFD